MKEHHIDFVVLDIMMPGMDGLEVCRNIRSNYNMPILLLSARDRDIDKVIGLEIGADDYMTKPFSIQELTSRIKAHLRKIDRLYKEWSNQVKTPDLIVNDSLTNGSNNSFVYLLFLFLTFLNMVKLLSNYIIALPY